MENIKDFLSTSPPHHLSHTFTICAISPTQFGKHNEVFCIALRAGNTSCAVASLLLVDPTLQTGLVHPLGRATAAARTHPFSCAVILVCGKAYPTAPESKRTHPKAW